MRGQDPLTYGIGDAAEQHICHSGRCRLERVLAQRGGAEQRDGAGTKLRGPESKQGGPQTLQQGVHGGPDSASLARTLRTAEFLRPGLSGENWNRDGDIYGGWARFGRERETAQPGGKGRFGDGGDFFENAGCRGEG